MTIVSEELRIARGESFPYDDVWTTGDAPNGITPTPVDMTGAVGVFSVRVAHDPSSATLLTQAATLGSDGSVVFTLSPTQTLSVPQGTYPIDLFITFSNGTVTKFLSGSATFS